MVDIASLNGDAGTVWQALTEKGLATSDLLDLQDTASRTAYRRQQEQDPGAAFDKMLTDLGNARRFAKDHAGRILYTKAHGWLAWDGRRWAVDDTGAAERLARLTVRRLWDELQRMNDELRQLADDADPQQADIDKQKKRITAHTSWSIKSQSRQRIDAMLALARSETGIAVHAEDFDATPWLLNVRNGTLDLKTGTLKPHDPNDKITKLIDIDYAHDAACPLWTKFLETVLPDAEVRQFLQRWVGYCLTGDVSEQAFAFLYGKGQNGKSLFAGTLLRMMGEYGLKMATETITETKRQAGAASEDIARLHGKRFYLTTEWQEGTALDENLVKDLTGGDVLAARFLHKGTFEFMPVGKLTIVGNHKPVIKGDDLGIWRRVREVPFTVTIPDDEKDPQLAHKLLTELPGILAWAVAGCADWQANGLGIPQAVKQATDAYKEASDTLGAWIAECCDTEDKSAATATGVLFASWQEWAKKGGHKPQTLTWFGRKLGERGYEKTTDRTPLRKGISVIGQETQKPLG